MSCSMFSRDLYLVVIAVTAENAVSHKYVVAHGNKTLTAFSDSSGYSQERLMQTDISAILLNCKRRDLSDDSSASCFCSRPVESVRTHSNGFLIQSSLLLLPSHEQGVGAEGHGKQWPCSAAQIALFCLQHVDCHCGEIKCRPRLTDRSIFVTCSRTPWQPSTDPQGSADHRLKTSAIYSIQCMDVSLTIS